jgi:bifunctional non-homologous end joining protein LigD
MPAASTTTTKPPLDGAKRGSPPRDQTPQLCRLVEDAPDGDAWLNEIKFDGYRMLAWKAAGKVRLITRNGLDWTDRLPTVAKAIAGLNIDNALLDGELVALRKDGATSFPDLQAALSAGRDRALHFFAFDLLALDGWDLRACKLIDRKRLLEPLDDWQGLLRYSAHVVGNAGAMRTRACGMNLEGIICKKADAPYRAGRNGAWVKVKCLGREELIVLGWTPPAGSRTGIGALHVGYYDPGHRLHYAGGVGTGFSERELTALRSRLDTLAADPPKALQVAGDKLDDKIRWVRMPPGRVRAACATPSISDCARTKRPSRSCATSPIPTPHAPSSNRAAASPPSCKHRHAPSSRRRRRASSSPSHRSGRRKRWAA